MAHPESTNEIQKSEATIRYLNKADEMIGNGSLGEMGKKLLNTEGKKRFEYLLGLKDKADKFNDQSLISGGRC